MAAHKATKKYVIVNKSTNDIDKAWAAIETAVCQGLFSTTFTSGPLDLGLKEYLEASGYVVYYRIIHELESSTEYTISWEDI